MIRSRLPLAALVLAAAPGCSKPAPPDNTADVAAVAQVREREIAAFNSGQVDSLLAVYTIDVVVMPPGAAQLTGHDAVRSWVDGMKQQATLSGHYTGSSVQVVGDWAIEQVTAVWSATPLAGGTAVTEQVKGVHVYRRQPDGGWRIALDVWNSDAPPAAPAEAGP